MQSRLNLLNFINPLNLLNFLNPLNLMIGAHQFMRYVINPAQSGNVGYRNIVVLVVFSFLQHHRLGRFHLFVAGRLFGIRGVYIDIKEREET